MKVESSLSDARPPEEFAAGAETQDRWFFPLMRRLHFYSSLLVGPFVLVAALTGALFALSPQIEAVLYEDVLYTDSTGEASPLQAQIEAAQIAFGNSALPAAVRPAPSTGETTRVMFAQPGLGPSEHRAIFVDPVTAEVTGDLIVYGTSGALPFRIWLDYLHRNLHMGDFGRHYSELAASWLWLVALGGLVSWTISIRTRSRARRSPDQPADAGSRAALSRQHATAGLILLLAMLFFSATGLSWSQWAGDNIYQMRMSLDWGTPRVDTTLPGRRMADTGSASHAHSHHDSAITAAGTTDAVTALEQFDAVLGAARQSGIDAGKIEIKPASGAGQAWTVTEIDRSWPTQVDAVAIDPQSLDVIDRTRFEDFPIAAKLTRWGIDAHMGILFGLPNQLAVVAAALGLCMIAIWGYRMWWRRRSAMPRSVGAHRLTAELRRVPASGLGALALVAILVGWFLPVMGISLAAFLLIDWLLGRVERRRLPGR